MRLAGIRAALLAAVALLSPAAATAQAVPIALAPGEVLLQVQATGEHRARPDVMTITAGVVTTGRTAGEALSANSALAGRLIEAVRQAGVEPRDVRTAELSVDPRFEERGRGGGEDQAPRITGYTAANRVELRLRDLARASAVVEALFQAGANSVRGPDFSLSDPKPAEREARRAAIAAAKEEADTYASALGMRVARVLRVGERGAFETGDGYGIMVTGSKVGRTPLEPGELATRIDVLIDYALVLR
jgi:uncharacterized protein YggE